MKRNSVFFLEIILWPIIFMVGQFFIRYIFVALYNYQNYHNTNLYKIMQTVQYQDKLNQYLNHHTLLMALIIAIIFIPLFYLIYKKYRNYNKIKYKSLISFIILSSLFALLFNSYISIIFDYSISNLPIYIQIICSGIIGPIIEELLFRGIIFNKLKERYNVEKAMLLSTIIFSLLHLSTLDIIYTMFFGYLLVYTYNCYHNLKYPIMMHIMANTMVIIFGTIVNLNIIIFIVSLILLIIFYYKLFINACFTK